jgi:hypothetical protein
MTMHLEGPWLTTTGKIKSKRRRWASAEAAQKARELTEEWEHRQSEWSKLAPRFSSTNLPAAKKSCPGPQYPPGREPQKVIPSRPDTPGTVASRPADKVYTGTAMKGIGVLHKSNSVPVFSDEEAVDIARMRR